MATPETISVSELAAPISEDSPVGEYLKNSGGLALFTQFSDALDRAKSLTRAALQGDEGADAPDWKAPVKVAEEILKTKSKDLWVATGLIEASVRLHGFAGLRDGLRLARELVERYWGALYPPVDPDDLIDGYYTTTDRLKNLDAAIPDALRLLPLADSPDYPEYTFFDYHVASEGRGGEITVEMLEGAVRTSPPAMIKDLREDISGTLEELRLLDEAFESRFAEIENGRDLMPSFYKMRQALDDCQRCLRVLSGEDPDAGEEAVEDGAGGAEGEPSQPAQAVAAVGPIASREDAFRMMEKLASYFEKNEPHSPLGPALRELVTWRIMSFPDLMKHLLEDSSALKDLFRRTGVSESQEGG
jgi:type VI secretion system protein ImpA